MIKIMFALIFIFSVTKSFCSSLEEDISSAENKKIEMPSPFFEKDDSSREELRLFLEYMDSLIKTQEQTGEKFYPNKSGGQVDAVYSIELSKIKNEYLKGPITFKTSKGTLVYVSGSKAVNCPDLSNKCADKDKFFMTLTTQRSETFFIRAMEIVNWGIFMSGSKTVVIDGEKYTAKVYANASEPAKSKLEIKGPSGAVVNSSLDKLGEAVAAKAFEIRLSKTYKLAYGSEIIQTGGGNAKFTENNLLLLIPFPVQDASNYFLIKESEIKPSGTVFPSMEPNYVFKIINGNLEIYKK